MNTLGGRYVLLRELKGMLHEYFGEVVVDIVFTYGDDGSIDAIHELRCTDPGGTFRLFTHHTEPSVLALLSKVFRNPDEPRIGGITARHDDFVFDKESAAKREELVREYNLDSGADWIHEMEADGNEPYRKAQEEWSQWVDDVTTAIRFVSVSEDNDKIA